MRSGIEKKLSLDGGSINIIKCNVVKKVAALFFMKLTEI